MKFTGHILFKVNKAKCLLPENTFNINELSYFLNFYEDRRRVFLRDNNLVRRTFLLLKIFIL